jgi:ABC-type phosphate transport system permease subunit
MKHEEKVAIVTGLSVGLVAGGLAAIIGTPVALATAIYGTYKTTKGVYESAKLNKPKP